MANPIVRYIQESREELKKVTWPSRQQVTRDTMVVIGISVAVAAFFGAIDYGLMALFRYYI
jgi:preprotein translocase subunit SecE